MELFGPIKFLDFRFYYGIPVFISQVLSIMIHTFLLTTLSLGNKRKEVIYKEAALLFFMVMLSLTRSSVSLTVLSLDPEISWKIHHWYFRV